MMEMILVLLLVAVVATFSYARGLRVGRLQGHAQGLFNGTIMSEITNAILEADRELRGAGLHDELDEDDYSERLFARVDEIMEEKFGRSAK